MKYMINVVSTLNQYQPSGLLSSGWYILVTRVDTACDTDFDMCYSIYIYHILYNNSFCMRSIRGLCRPTELYRPRTWLYRPNRSIWTEDVVRGRYTSVGRYKHVSTSYKSCNCYIINPHY